MMLQDIEAMTDAEKLALVKAIQENVASSKAKQVSLETGQYAKLVVDAIKKIKTDLEERYAEISAEIVSKSAAIRDGKDGINGAKGEKGDTGLRGLDGANGRDGLDGKDGIDGVDGNGVMDARIDFDGSLVIVLDNGTEINAGEVVPFDIAEKIKIIGNGGGTSQYVLDTLASLQASIDSISPTLVITDTFVVGSQAAMIALTAAEKGDVAVRTDVNKTFILTANPYSTLGNWQELLTPTDVVTSVAGRTGAITLSYTDISGLGTAATTNSTAYATAAQGVKADSALQTIASADGSIVVTTVGTSVDLAVSQTSPASVLVEQVRNTTGATLTKGTAVYISGATGQIPTVSKALATGDSTSAQTLGLITSDLANNSNGYVTLVGLVANINTSAYTDGAQLYLSPTTAGTLTATKPYAPQHLVYVAIVAHAHPTQGKLIVKVQNGYEMDELHNVSAQSPTTGQTLVYNSSTSLWEKNTVSLTAGVNGTLPVANGGTGVTTSTGSGNNVLSTSPTLVTPILGTPTSGNLANCTFPTLNQNTTGTAASTPKLLSTNFTIEESGGKLLFKYGATTIASMSSTGVITSATNIVSNGTP
jgi:hypothetical protein